MTRVLLALLLGIVAAAAAVLSFSALDELGRLRGFGPPAWQLPVVPDAAGILEGVGERGHSSPWHRHRRATETFVVLDGELLIDVDGQRHVAGPSHTAVLPRDLPHGFVLVSDRARWLTLHTPAGFDAFVRAISDTARAAVAPDRAALTAIAAEHCIDVLGPGQPLHPREVVRMGRVDVLPTCDQRVGVFVSSRLQELADERRAIPPPGRSAVLARRGVASGRRRPDDRRSSIAYRMPASSVAGGHRPIPSRRPSTAPT